MLFRLLLIFCLVPLVELTLLLWLADVMGWKTTLGVVLLTGIAGSWLARRQGLSCYRRIHQELQAGRMPGDALLDALLVFFAGTLLITPGVLTDLIGFALLLPPSRGWARGVIVRWAKNRFHIDGQFDGTTGAGPFTRDEIIDVRVIDPKRAPEDENPAS